jgi:hypothetical protein
MQIRSFESELSRMSFAHRSFRSVPFVENAHAREEVDRLAEPLVEERLAHLVEGTSSGA